MRVILSILGILGLVPFASAILSVPEDQSEYFLVNETLGGPLVCDDAFTLVWAAQLNVGGACFRASGTARVTLQAVAPKAGPIGGSYRVEHYDGEWVTGSFCGHVDLVDAYEVYVTTALVAGCPNGAILARADAWLD